MFVAQFVPTGSELSIETIGMDAMASEVSTAGDQDLRHRVAELERELAEAHEQQAATSEILRVISASPTDLKSVLNAVAENAARICAADDVHIWQRDGEELQVAASYGMAPLTRRQLTISRKSVVGRAVHDQMPVHVEDLAKVVDTEFPDSQGMKEIGNRTILAMPLLSKGEVIGAIMIRRKVVRPFSAAQVALLCTFADQAVIAIENTRLFEAEQASKRELQESLEYQTATSEVLDVISRSPTDAQPVFDTIAQSAARLCMAQYCHVFRFDGQLIHFVASHGLSPEARRVLRSSYPMSPGQGSAAARSIVSGTVEEIPDVSADREFLHGELAKTMNFHSAVAVPMLKNERPIGSIAIARSQVGRFPKRQIELLRTFADQAVIAVENTRLFEQVQARNRDLTALGEVGRAVSSTLDLNTVLKTIVDRAVTLSDTHAGSIFYYRHETGTFELGETSGFDEQSAARIRELDISASDTGLGEAIAKRRPVQFPDVSKARGSPLRDAVLDLGLRAVLIVPLIGAEGPLGALVLRRRQSAEFPETVVSLMQAFADQSAIALENARLFNEIARKSRELEIASQHKSQFVANMSHELRTPLAAILGYAELMQEGFYEPLGQKSLDALTRIRSNGKHLLGLINTVLDIAKVESGQFTLNMTEYAIESVVETVRSATESLAQNKKLTLRTEVAKSLPIGLGDEQRVTQVLLNLVGNAIKFTDTGEVRVSATAANSHFTVTVADTGPGIPETHLTRIFEQFHQVDSSNTKAKGGTGLGLAIAKQIVEMHGGRLWVESTLGMGSTFQMELPIRAEFQKTNP
jgi:signal transduction histidine kinase